ncbi:hypothetical protein CISIN_1g048262mg [Citrus sinensis]|uniref:Uncharacterized protein n=1 Tax=Citrus sinensis TaxID=2711 RepID=A0A067D6B1_CITSI|nr:hypothetical protein CISIN_1g048262mg [Citrus sinensis]
MAPTPRSTSYTHKEDIHLFHIYLDISQNPIVGINQSRDAFWSRVEIEYNNSKPDFTTQDRPRRYLQKRMQSILAAIGKLRGCVRQIENLNLNGASKQDINYNKGFKFDHVWPILKDTEKNWR